jgi:hypothetical protein
MQQVIGTSLTPAFKNPYPIACLSTQCRMSMHAYLSDQDKAQPTFQAIFRHLRQSEDFSVHVLCEAFGNLSSSLMTSQVKSSFELIPKSRKLPSKLSTDRRRASDQRSSTCSPNPLSDHNGCYVLSLGVAPKSTLNGARLPTSIVKRHNA